MPKANLTRITAIGAALTIVAAAVAYAHDMFLKPTRYFVEPNAEVLVRILNGTFSKSENSIARARLRDVSVVGPAGRQQIDTAQWTVAGDTSTFRIHTGAAGTYQLGVSTKQSVLALTAKEFNAYLSDDGIPDVLDARRRDGELERPVRERYWKHVKAVIQVGSPRTDHALSAIGYPAEIVPLENPYARSVGDTLRVRTLVDGKPASRQYVLYGGRLPNGEMIAQRNTRSDADGIAGIPLRTAGTWYVKFISMARTTGDSVDYESKWATLTFQVR